MPTNAVVRGSTDIATSGWDKVSSDSVICSGTLRMKSANTSAVLIRSAGNPTVTVPLEAGSTYPLVNIDISTLELQASESGQGFEFVGDTYRSAS
jgi:hypothetical protein